MKIDDLCLRLLALWQPRASDLRFIMIGLKISKDLERMGDLAVNIAEQTTWLNQIPQIKPYVDLPKMSDIARQMVRDSLDSFVNRNAEQAQAVCGVDDQVDELHVRIFDDLISVMQKDPNTILGGVRLIIISRHLERIADHATNIAEQVVFMTSGKDIRHGSGGSE